MDHRLEVRPHGARHRPSQAIDELLRLAATKTPFGMASTLSTRPTAQIAVCEAMATARSARALLVEETTRVWGSSRQAHP